MFLFVLPLTNVWYNAKKRTGGAQTNNQFLQAGVVDKVILNYNPVIFNQGIGVFEGDFIEQKLTLEQMKQEQQGIVQIHYQVEKEK